MKMTSMMQYRTDSEANRREARKVELLQTLCPVGYRYVEEKGNGKVLVRDEPLASSVREAIEGYASGRFEQKEEVRRFLQAQPGHPKRNYKQEVEDLRRPIYAGYVEHARWGVSLRKGKHEPIISLETYSKNQERLAGRSYAPRRKDAHMDFPA